MVKLDGFVMITEFELFGMHYGGETTTNSISFANFDNHRKGLENPDDFNARYSKYEL